MIKLRPHHLLCTQGYSGKGYSREFVENMTEIVKSIKNEKVQVQLIFSEDDICSKCPNLSENNICKSDTVNILSLIHISEPTRLRQLSRMPSAA